MSTTRRHGRTSLVPIALITLIVLSITTVAQATSHPIKIKRFGNPVTAFSKEPVDTLDKLQSQVTTYRSDIETVLRESGWDGDPRDFFAAVESGKAERVMVPVGEVMPWMAFRKNKRPVISKRSVEWAGKEPFDAWRIEFESGDAVHTFIIPVVCLNIAYYKEGPPYPTPSCDLRAETGAADCGELAAITLSGKTDGNAMEITEIVGSDGRGVDPGGAKSVGQWRWTYQPSAPGSYRFTAVAANEHGKTTSCTATSPSVPEVVPCVDCSLSVTYDEASRTFTLDASGSVGAVEITAITLPDGTSGNLGALVAAGANRWTYAPEVPKKRGDYVYEFSARATDAGVTDVCDPVAVTIPGKRGPARAPGVVGAPDRRWILRAYGARIDADERLFTSEILPSGVNERNHLSVDSGEGFGLGLEYLLNRRIGIEGGILFGDLETQLMRDLDEEWETDEDDAEFTPITLGVNFHLTPGRKFDLFAGPFLAQVLYDDVEYQALGLVTYDIDDEFTWGAQIGVDVPTGTRAAFTASVKYIDTNAETDDDEVELTLDPLVFTAGIAFRF